MSMFFVGSGGDKKFFVGEDVQKPEVLKTYLPGK